MNKKENANKAERLPEAEIREHFAHFEDIVYDNLQKILVTRPKNPVSKFAKMILEDAGLDKNGDPLPDAKVPQRADRKRPDESEGEEKPKKKTGRE